MWSRLALLSSGYATRCGTQHCCFRATHVTMSSMSRPANAARNAFDVPQSHCCFAHLDESPGPLLRTTLKHDYNTGQSTRPSRCKTPARWGEWALKHSIKAAIERGNRSTVFWQISTDIGKILWNICKLLTKREQIDIVTKGHVESLKMSREKTEVVSWGYRWSISNWHL